MLRTSLRIDGFGMLMVCVRKFLSSNAQDFIEDMPRKYGRLTRRLFLSSNAQDFIEEIAASSAPLSRRQFLSSNAQDFIEDEVLAHGMRPG